MSLTIKHRVSLDLSLTSVQATIPFRKGDKGAHEVIFSLRNGTTNVELPPGTVATIAVFNGAKDGTNDGAGVVDMCTVDHINHRIIYIPTVAALSVAGNVACELTVVGTNGEVLGAPRIHFFVDESMTDVTEEEIAEALKASGSWDVIQKTAENANAAAQSKEDAETAQGKAETAQGKAETAQGAAVAAKTAAEAAQGKAETAQGKAETAQGKAETAQGKAEAAKTAAETAQGKAEAAKTAAETAQGKAETAKTAAETAQGKAETAKTAAESAKNAADAAKVGAQVAQAGAYNSASAASVSAISAEESKVKAEEYAEKIGAGAASITASLNDRDYKLTIALLDASGKVMLPEATIDLPLESSITNITYDDASKDLIFTLRNGNTTRVPLDAIVSGLATEAALNAGLAGKVDKLTGDTATLKLYGTDSNGDQTSYSIVGTTGNSTLAIMPQAAVTAVLDARDKLIDTNKDNIAKNAEDIASNAERISELEKGGGNAEQIVKEELAKYFIVEESINLFDKSTVELIPDLIMPNNTTLTNANISHFLLPVAAGKTYTFPIYYSTFGYDAAYRVPCFNSAGEYTGTITGTPTADNAYLTFTNTDAAYVKLNVAVNKYVSPNLDTFMIVEGDTYPSEYHAYGAGGVTLNPVVKVSGTSTDPLFGKKVVFTGDSICAGTSDESGVRGWAQRIGEKYSMSWQNKGINGATITLGVSGSSACIADTDFGENPDYIILEGGVNDADLIKTADTFTPAKYGSFNNYSFTSDFDKTTFCGAVEHLFKRVTTDYVGAKIGFIIAHKQGMATSAMDYTAEQSYRRFYFETIIKLCKKWGIPYLDLWEGCYLCPMNPAHNTKDTNLMYVGDYQHLASKGYDYITPMIEAWMKTL